MLLTEIDHIAIAVKDLEAAIAYYQNAFGATVDHREVVESDGVEEALLKVAESYIQLLTPTRPDSPVAKAIGVFCKSKIKSGRIRIPYLKNISFRFKSLENAKLEPD